MDRRRKILHLTYSMGVGGTEQVIFQLVNHLDDSDFESSIGCIEGEVGILGQPLQDDGLNFHVFRRKPGFDLHLVRQVRSVIIDHQFDIIHCHQYTPFVYGVLAALFSKTKVVYTEHGRFYPDKYSWKRRLINPLLGRVTDSIVAISKATSEALAFYEWFSPRAIEVIYNGMPPPDGYSDALRYDSLGIDSGSVVFGTIARFDSIKNLPMMIKGFSRVEKINPDVRLLLVGDGEERPALESLVEQHGLQGKVIFTGFQKNTGHLMSLIDVYLLTSFSEGTSMTLIEAMSGGTCSIVTGVGGNVEIIEHGVSGIVVESGDVDELSSWMIQLAGDSGQRRSLGDAGRKVYSARFSIEKMIESYTNMYHRILR